MSWQAMTAVRLHSSFIKERDFGAYRVLEAIADRSDEFGVCGVVGNTKRCLSYSGIAKEARVHRNTVYNLMPALLESGELEIVEQGGDGRGAWTVYRVTIVEKLAQGDVTFIQGTSQGAALTAELAPESSQQPAELSQLMAVTIRLVTIVEELSQRVERLSQQIERTSQQKPETSQGIVTSNGCDRSVEFQESSVEFLGEGSAPSPRTANTVHPDCPYPQTDQETAVATHPAIWAWLEASMAWPGFESAAYITERLGETPDAEALKTARQLWNLSNNKPGNAIGILDWYDELRLDPEWTPKKRFAAKGKQAAQPAPSAGMKPIAPGLY
ncbi:MAG: hypothetical protein IPM39_15230 [Chloroflexi bacterium]|nr:hypothetical protein [Chloroflexota bacterium]